ncbi:hypothetical protein ACFLZ8_02470 [Planctomycetota bacterium]
MAKEKKKYRELGTWLPQRIRELSFLSGDDKIYYAHIYSFGERGCWQTDEQIGKALGCSERSIQRYQSHCNKAGLLKVIGKKSKYRRIWAKDHPKYITMRKKKAIQLRQERQSSTTKLSELLRQNCPTTNKYTNKRTNKKSGGSPLPVEQAHALQKNKQQQLEAYRTKEETITSIEQLKNSFGYSARRRTTGLSSAEWEQRRQKQQKELLAVKTAEKG